MAKHVKYNSKYLVNL